MEAQASKGAVINGSCAICEHQLLGLASLLCRSSDSLGEFRSDECAAPVKLLEDEVQHVFLGRRLRVWQKVPPERHAFLVGDNQFTDAWVVLRKKSVRDEFVNKNLRETLDCSH